MISKKELFKLLDAEGNSFGGLNVFPKIKEYNGDVKKVFIFEKSYLLNKIVEKFPKLKNVLLISSPGFPSKATITGLIQLKQEYNPKMYYLGDLDSTSLMNYYIYTRGINNFNTPKVSDKDYSLNYGYIVSKKIKILDIKYLGLTPSDIKKYEIPKNHHIKIEDNEKRILEYIKEKKLLSTKEVKFLEKGQKVEIDCIIINKNFKKFIKDKLFK